MGNNPIADDGNSLEAARVLLAQGKFKETVDACEVLISNSGEDVDTLRVLGNAAVQLGNSELINSTWLAIVKANPEDSEALFHLGNQAHQHGDFDEAIAFFERALVQSPTHTALLNNLGLALESTGRYIEAERQFRLAYQTTPDVFETIANLAQNLFQQDRLKDALQWYDLLDTKFDVNDATILANRAVCQHALSDDEGAFLSYERALKVEKESAELYLEFGIVNRELRQFDSACEALEQCLSIDPENTRARNELLVCHQFVADWKNFDTDRARLMEIATSVEALSDVPIDPFMFMAICDDPVLQKNVSSAWILKKISDQSDQRSG